MAAKKKSKPAGKAAGRNSAARKKPPARSAKPAAKKSSRPSAARAPLKKKKASAATRSRTAPAKAPAKPKRPAPAPRRSAPVATVRKPASAAAAAPRAVTTGKPVPRQKIAPAPIATETPVARPAPYQAARGEEYMNSNQVSHFRQLLMTWRHELMQEVDRTVHHMQDDAANFPDPNDRATQEEEFALELRTRDRERKLIKKINESLAALDAGTYGYCEMCGVEIGIKRLEARPTATLCIDCKTLDEIRERQRA